MGHIATKKAYLDLQKRLDRMPIGAPQHRALFAILEELFTEEECRVAAAIPLRIAKLGQIAKNAGLGEKRTLEVLDTLVEKGLVVDLPRHNQATCYYLNPVIIGFFEFTMMRVRPEIDQKKVAELMWTYLREDPDLGFMRMMMDGDTFIARPLVNEGAVSEEVYSEVLDWERATEVVDQAASWAEGICHCRHVKLHLGKRCDYPLDHCLTLGHAADYLVRAGIAKRIDHARAREILEYAREHGNVQMADNVRSRPGFICNCCKCCCEMMEGFRTLPLSATVVSSNFIAVNDNNECTGCGKCAEACPIDAIELVDADPTEKTPKRKKKASVDSARCLGCGVCYTACKFNGLTMQRSERRIYTPENTIEKMLLQAVERGKVQHLLFNDPSRLTHRVLAGFFSGLLALPPAKQVLARDQIKSKFVGILLDRLGRTRDARRIREARA